MHKGHGLLDRFLVSVPNARKPTPEQEEEATEYLEGLQLKDFQAVFAPVDAAHRDDHQIVQTECRCCRIAQAPQDWSCQCSQRRHWERRSASKV